MNYGDYRWDDSGVPAGPAWVRVDLDTQLISVFRAGHEIGTAVIVYGGDNKETPTGKLHILARARDHRSSLYDAAMPYTLRLTGDGVSIHDLNDDGNPEIIIRGYGLDGYNAHIWFYIINRSWNLLKNT